MFTVRYFGRDLAKYPLCTRVRFLQPDKPRTQDHSVLAQVCQQHRPAAYQASRHLLFSDVSASQLRIRTCHGLSHQKPVQLFA